MENQIEGGGGKSCVMNWLCGKQELGRIEPMSNLSYIKDALNREVETYTLDIQDRPVSISNVESQTMNVAYGVGDMVKSVTRFDGTTVSNSYDGQARLIGTSWPDASTTFSYYDNALLKTVASESGTFSNTYDNANRLAAVASVYSVYSVVNEYLLDGIGNATNVLVSVDGSGILTNAYTFDAAERVSAITGESGTFAFDYSPYNGLVASVSNTTSGIHADYQFDDLDRLTNIVWRNGAGGVLRSFAYGYDNAGMITNVARETGSRTAYLYDSLDRLTAETVYASGGGVSNAYSWKYDLVGNRTQAVVNAATTSYTLGVGNRLASFGASGAVSHDAAGNITNIVYNDGRELDLEWNSRYQLEAVYTNGTLAESYTYDSLGQRISISDGVTTNWLVYNGPHIVADLDSNGDMVRSYQHGSGVDNLLSMTVYTGTVVQTYYALTDHLGTIHAWADEGGTIVEQYQYTAWGEVSVFDGSGAPLAQSAIGNRYTFQGREVSWKTGLMHFRARSYDPHLGRWLSKDPIGISGGLDQYVAFDNCPAKFIDPLGLDAWRGFGQGLTQNVTWSASIGAWAGAGPVISGIQANTVADAVNTALGDLGLSGRVFPYNPAFAGVFDPSFTASWPQSISFHSTRTFSRESPRVPGSRYAVKYYEEPCGEKKAALTPPTGTAYHDWQAFRYYFLGENVNLEHAVDFLVNRNYPLWQYNVVLPVK